MKHLACPKKLLLTALVIILGIGLPNCIFAKKKQPTHPHYVAALSYLRAARWLIDHRPGNWQQSIDEQEAVRRIDAAINEIQRAATNDGKNLNDHPAVEERADHGGRLALALEFLERGKSEINREEDNAFAQGLQARAVGHIDGSIGAVYRAMMAVGAGAHPGYIKALSELRGARWLIEHRPGNWQQTMDEQQAVRRIDQAINAIKKAAIDDGKNIDDHPPVDERPDRGGRLRLAQEFLERARQYVNKEEDNSAAQNLKVLAIEHINASIALLNNALHGQ
jgi:tetratricopeptide (TPR) repeat protein